VTNTDNHAKLNS